MTMTETRSTALFRKLRAMMAQAESTTFEEERRAFEAKAQRMMTEHGITLAMLVDAGKAEAEEIIKATIHVPGPHASITGALAWRTAELNRCKAIRDGGRNRKTGGYDFHIVGFRSDVEWISMLSEALVRHAHNELAAARKTTTWRMSGAESMDFARAFLLGYLSEVIGRLTAANAEAEKAAAATEAERRRDEGQVSTAEAVTTSMALVLRGNAEKVDETYKVHFPRTRTLPGAKRARSGAGRAAGRAAGSRAPLAKSSIGSRGRIGS